MPRLRFVDELELDAEARALIASAERTGAPDPRVVRIMVRSSAGRAWVKCWNSVLYEGKLPHKLKEMCRIRISVAHKCGYCSTVRSNVAKAEGLSEDLVHDLPNDGTRLSPREEIIELGMLCAQTVGVGRLVRSLAILSWEEACEINPALAEKA